MSPERLAAVASSLVRSAAAGTFSEGMLHAVDQGWRSVFVVDSHTAGMPTRIIVDGFSVLPGADLAERVAYLQRECADEVLSLLKEPRGHSASCGVLVQPPITPAAEMSAIYLCTDGMLPVCGHASMGLVDALLRQDALVQSEGWQRTVVIDTLAGVLLAEVSLRADGELEVGLAMPGAQVIALDAQLGDDNRSAARIDLARCGGVYALVWLADPASEMHSSALSEFRARAESIMERVNRWLAEHALDHLPDCTHVMFVTAQGDSSRLLTLTVHDGFVDRSPCGTGSAALAAVMAEKFDVRVGAEFSNRSLSGGVFRVRVDSLEHSESDAVARCRIFGSSRLFGFSSHLIDRRDPLWKGFVW